MTPGQQLQRLLTEIPGYEADCRNDAARLFSGYGADDYRTVRAVANTMI